jgi:hypothetical protein
MTQRSEKEIDAEVIAEADDASKWELEAEVTPHRRKVNPSRLELAARFFVLSAIHRLGASAVTPAAGQDLGYDVAILDPEGNATTVQVKTITAGYRWHVDPIRARRNHYVVFVCFDQSAPDPEVAPEVFVLPSWDLARAIQRQNEPEIRIDAIGDELHGRHAWQRLIAPRAA